MDQEHQAGPQHRKQCRKLTHLSGQLLNVYFVLCQLDCGQRYSKYNWSFSYFIAIFASWAAVINNRFCNITTLCLLPVDMELFSLEHCHKVRSLFYRDSIMGAVFSELHFWARVWSLNHIRANIYVIEILCSPWVLCLYVLFVTIHFQGQHTKNIGRRKYFRST